MLGGSGPVRLPVRGAQPAAGQAARVPPLACRGAVSRQHSFLLPIRFSRRLEDCGARALAALVRDPSGRRRTGTSGTGTLGLPRAGGQGRRCFLLMQQPVRAVAEDLCHAAEQTDATVSPAQWRGPDLEKAAKRFSFE